MKEARMVINRFPICAAVHAAIAQKLGFPEKTAQAIGQACAIFYACAKRGAFRRGKGEKRGKRIKGGIEGKEFERIRFGEREFKAIKKDDILYPIMGDSVVTEKDFWKTLNSKVGEEKAKKFYEYLLNWLDGFPETALYRPYNIYVKVRDSFRTETFWSQFEN